MHAGALMNSAGARRCNLLGRVIGEVRGVPPPWGSTSPCVTRWHRPATSAGTGLAKAGQQVLGEAAHVWFEGLKHQQKGVDAGATERLNATSHFVVATDQTCSRAPIGTDGSTVLMHLVHGDLGIHVARPSSR